MVQMIFVIGVLVLDLISILPGGDDVRAQPLVVAAIPALLRGIKPHNGEEWRTQSAGELSQWADKNFSGQG